MADPVVFKAPNRIVVAVVTLVFLGLGPLAAWLLSGAMSELSDSAVTTGLTNIATVAGVSSGLSLAGVAVLTSQHGLLGKLMNSYGAYFHTILFGGYVLVVLGALLCGFLAMFPNQPFAKWVLVIAAVYTFEQLVVTARLISTSYSWGRISPSQAGEKDPGFSRP